MEKHESGMVSVRTDRGGHFVATKTVAAGPVAGKLYTYGMVYMRRSSFMPMNSSFVCKSISGLGHSVE